MKTIRLSTLVAACALAVTVALGVSCAGFQVTTSPFEGSWRSEAYGYDLTVRGRTLTIVDSSGAGRVESMKGTLSGSDFVLRGIPGMPVSGSLGLEGAALIMTTGGTVRMAFERVKDDELSSLPPLLPRTDDCLVNFEVFAATFGERYAFFEERRVDWQARVDEARPRAAAARGGDELFALLAGLARPLGDAHVTLYSLSGDEFTAAEPSAWWPEAQAFIDALKASYLAEQPRKAAGGFMAFGRLAAGPAYVCLLGMEGYAGEGASFEDESAALEAGLDEALSAAAGAPALILDLRFNGGGRDAHALATAARFALERTLAYSRRVRSGDGWTAEEDFFVEPAAGRPRWDGQGREAPLVVLTSRATTSAAEVLVLCLAALPGTIVVGETTQGAFSDMLWKRLPNGWVYTLSNQQYRDAGGTCHEAAGYPPDVMAPMDLEAARAGRDAVLDAALAAIAEKAGR